MKGAPWFKFFPSDFMAGVAEFTGEERGAYISLLCHQWTTGDLPADRMRLERLAGGPVSDAVALKFVPAATEGRVYNVRLESHREEAQRRSIAGSKAVERREAIRSIERASTDDRPKIDRSSTDEAPMHQRLEARGYMLEARGYMLDARDKKEEPKQSGGCKGVKVRKSFAYTEDFEQAWKAWPSERKGEKGAAFKRWNQCVGRPQLARILESIEEHRSKSQKWKDGYCPEMCNWIRDRGFDTTFESLATAKKPHPAQHVNSDLLAYKDYCRQAETMSQSERADLLAKARDTLPKELSGSLSDVIYRLNRGLT